MITALSVLSVNEETCCISRYWQYLALVVVILTQGLFIFLPVYSYRFYFFLCKTQKDEMI